MKHTRQGLTWWHAWVPLLLLGGLLVLEPQLPLASGGHQVVQLTLTLLMYGGVVCWLRRNRGALVNEAYQCEQAQQRRHTAGQARHEPAMSDQESWDDAGLPWQSNGYYTDTRRRR